MISTTNILINKTLTLYQRKNKTRFLGVKNIHHKINLRSHFYESNKLPYYWLLSEFDLYNECLQPSFN